MNEVSFDISPEDRTLTRAIVGRASPRYDMSLEMDLVATHANGCPMDFAKLLTVDDFNFWHDINGIQRNLNRETGKLQNCFLPRCHA